MVRKARVLIFVCVGCIALGGCGSGSAGGGLGKPDPKDLPVDESEKPRAYALWLSGQESVKETAVRTLQWMKCGQPSEQDLLKELEFLY